MKNIYLVGLFIFAVSTVKGQCNTSTSICTPGVAGPFSFINTPGPPVDYADPVGCDAGMFPQNTEFAFIILYITQTGPLNLLINGDTGTGYLDVVVYRIPDGIPPCTAVLNSANEIGCNYASSAGGCVQFGTAFPACTSTVPAPNVTAGDVLMIIVNNYSTLGSNNFTLQLGPTGAQTGPPAVGITPVGPICLTASPVQLIAENMGGTWSGPGVSSSGMFNPATAGIGTHTINYSLGQAPCNSASTTQISVVSDAVSGTASSTVSSICGSGDVPLTLTGSSGLIQWQSAASSNGPWTAINGATSATYTASNVSTSTCYRAQITGCGAPIFSNSVCVTITAGATPTVSNTGPYCVGETVQLNASVGDAYSWTGPGGFSSTSQNPIIPNATAAMSGPYTVSVTANGCSGSNSTNVVVNALPIVNAGVDFQTCTGSTITLSGSGAASYTWDNGVTNGQPFIISNTQTYTVTGTTNNCSSTDQITVTTTTAPTISFSNDLSNGCAPLTVNFTNTSAQTNNCRWDFGNGLMGSGNSASTTYTQGGCFDVTLVDTLLGCTVSLTQNDIVCVDAAPNAFFFASPSVLTLENAQVNFINNSQGATSYSWNFGDGTSGSNAENPEHDYSQQDIGSYIVTLVATSDLGCIDSFQVTIKIEEDLLYYVPNSFTPDGDIFNQTFTPVFTSGFDPFDYHLMIYDRWGELIFQSDDPNYGWDGSYADLGIVQAGLYTWKIEFKVSKNDERKRIFGHVAVLK